MGKPSGRVPYHVRAGDGTRGRGRAVSPTSGRRRADGRGGYDCFVSTAGLLSEVGGVSVFGESSLSAFFVTPFFKILLFFPAGWPRWGRPMAPETLSTTMRKTIISLTP